MIVEKFLIDELNLPSNLDTDQKFVRTFIRKLFRENLYELKPTKIIVVNEMSRFTLKVSYPSLDTKIGRKLADEIFTWDILIPLKQWCLDNEKLGVKPLKLIYVK